MGKTAETRLDRLERRQRRPPQRLIVGLQLADGMVSCCGRTLTLEAWDALPGRGHILITRRKEAIAEVLTDEE